MSARALKARHLIVCALLAASIAAASEGSATGIATADLIPEREAPPAASASPDTSPPQADEQAAPTPEAGPQAAAAAAPKSPAAEEMLRLLKAPLTASATDEERKDAAALEAFYGARADEPLWIDKDGAFTSKAEALMDEIGRADTFGLDAKEFTLPSREPRPLDAKASAEADLALTRAALKYARHARGGRILAPSELLNSHLDRRPQFIDPKDVLENLASADAPGEVLAKTNPQHVQFVRLREKYLEIIGKTNAKKPDKKLDAEKARILANMEMWRWMAADLGDLHIMANVPEFMIRLVKGGEVVHTERIVAGEIGKQTSIFSRPLKNIVLRPAWRVPESIMVHELWPSLLRGGGLFRQYGLELQTKDGKTLDYKSIDWKTDDIRKYNVMQPPGPKSVLGVVKFSFPSQHTIFMHDTPDKWMFGSKQRTLSHGCLRLRNPLKMAELILAEDKGWDRAKIDDLIRSGPLNNEVVIEKKIRMHIVYFTAWVGDDGRLATYPDVYGHEKRVRLALDGRWSDIDKGPDHLAPVEPGKAVASAMKDPAPQTTAARSKNGSANDDFMSSFFGPSR